LGQRLQIDNEFEERRLLIGYICIYIIKSFQLSLIISCLSLLSFLANDSLTDWFFMRK